MREMEEFHEEKGDEKWRLFMSKRRGKMKGKMGF